MKLSIAHRTMPMQGETRNGDAVFVRREDERRLCVVVIDALGHGPNAAVVADRALAHLEAASPSSDAVAVMKRLHDALRGTRGAAATVCTVCDGALSACGVGNVAMRVLGSSVPFVLSPGILGGRVQVFRGASAKLAPGDRIVIHSDGIGGVFSLDPLRGASTEEACARIFAEQRKATDDATLLVLDAERSP